MVENSEEISFRTVPYCIIRISTVWDINADLDNTSIETLKLIFKIPIDSSKIFV